MNKIENKIKKYLSYSEKVKKMEKAMAALKEEFIQLGNMDTERYKLEILERQREGLKGKAEFERILGREFLNVNNLISISTYKVVDIKAR